MYFLFPKRSSEISEQRMKRINMGKEREANNEEGNEKKKEKKS